MRKALKKLFHSYSHQVGVMHFMVFFLVSVLFLAIFAIGDSAVRFLSATFPP